MKSEYAIHPALVYLHIVLGTIALLSGAAALIFRKGSPGHRTTGKTYTVSMLGMAAIGAYGSWFVPEMISVMAGVLTFYLVATAWRTVTTKKIGFGLFETLGLLMALSVTAAGWIFAREASTSETGLKDGFSPGIYYFFGSIALLAAAFDIRLLIKKSMTGKQRMIRHLWRMCFALFIATTSLFLGQSQVFPQFIRETVVLFLPIIIVILTLLYWLSKVLFTKWTWSAR